MKIKLTDKQKKQVEQAAVAAVLQTLFQGEIEIRREGILAELARGEDDLTAEDIHTKYLGEVPALAMPTQGLLVPKH